MLPATPFAGRPLFPIVAPSGIPTPHGLLPRLLENPGREWHQLSHRLLAALSSPTLWLPAVAVVLTVAAAVACCGCGGSANSPTVAGSSDC